MPYHIEQNDGKHCVIADMTGENMGCHDTEAEAQDHMAALYANVEDAGKTHSKPETKCITVKASDAELNGNRFRGVPSVMGNVDEGGDVIAPGAFKTALADFLKAGFVPVGHDWYDLPVAMPISAREEGNKLVAEAEFHTTQRAQEARTIMRERLERGLDVGLSIGFDIDKNGQQNFDTGDELLAYLEETGHDLQHFDAAGIRKARPMFGLRLITKIRRLFEFSIVSVPMNPLAIATAAKIHATYDFDSLATEREVEAFLREVGLSKNAALKFISTFKGIILPRDADGSDAPDPDGQEPPAETAGQKPPTEPVVIEPRPLLYVPSTGRFIPNVTSH